MAESRIFDGSSWITITDEEHRNASDPHTQYALADGTRGAFAAPLGADDNYVTDAEKAALHAHSNKAALDLVSGTNTGDQVLPTWSTISGKPAVVAEGATQADARTAIGAGTSSFSGAYADLSGKPTLGDAAAKNTGTTAGTVAAGDDSRIGKIGGTVTVTGTPTAGQVPIASSGTAAAWGTPSGGGGGGLPPVTPTGAAITPPGYPLTARDIGVAFTSGTSRYYPMRLDAPWTLTDVAINVNTAAAGSTIHVALYRDPTATVQPGALVSLVSGAGFSSATTGAKSASSLGLSLSAGHYVFVVYPQGGSPTLLGYLMATPFMDGGVSNQIVNRLERSAATYPLPDPGQAYNGVGSGNSLFSGVLWLKGTA